MIADPINPPVIDSMVAMVVPVSISAVPNTPAGVSASHPQMNSLSELEIFRSIDASFFLAFSVECPMLIILR